MEELNFRKILADNLIYFRKKSGLTQAEAAAHINYSDKSVSKWERAEGTPDVFVLNQLAALYGVEIGMLVSERSADMPDEVPAVQEEENVPMSRRKSPFVVCLAVGGVWLIATVIFSVLNMLPRQMSSTYLAFIYAVPASFVVMEVFTAAWKLPSILHLLFSSGILWTLAVSLHLSAYNVENIYLIYVIAAVGQLLAIFAMGLYWQMIHMPKDGIKCLFRRRVKEKKQK